MALTTCLIWYVLEYTKTLYRLVYIDVMTFTYWCTTCSVLYPVVYKEPYLLVYCESALEVYDVITGKWVQIVPFRKLHALSTDGSLTMCCANDPCTLLYLKKQMDEGVCV